MFKLFRKNERLNIGLLLASSLLARFVLYPLIERMEVHEIKLFVIIAIFFIGVFYTLKGCADVIEETTDVLSEKTKFTSGLLQSFGTAFPDMVLGVVAALISIQSFKVDYMLGVSFAIIAASTTFGSNIYNIGHAIWCVFRQNLANKSHKELFMFPFWKKGGVVKPMQVHETLPSIPEVDTTTDVLVALTLLTMVVAVGMVAYGKVSKEIGLGEDLYQLIRPIGFVVFALSLLVLYLFRKTKRQVNLIAEIETEEKYYRKQPLGVIFGHLGISGVTILFMAEAMVHSIKIFCDITGFPVIAAGVAAGLIGCLGEMIVVHNYTVNPKGRIGDALMGVAMDNIVTTMGAAVVAIMGGIFLGGSALILIFVIILTLNSLLIWQVSKLKSFLLVHQN